VIFLERQDSNPAPIAIAFNTLKVGLKSHRRLVRQLHVSGSTQRGGAKMMDGSGFMQGVWCGAIFGAALAMLILSFIFEGSQGKQREREQEVIESSRFLSNQASSGERA
jgi:hypothetical protein